MVFYAEALETNLQHTKPNSPHTAESLVFWKISDRHHGPNPEYVLFYLIIQTNAVTVSPNKSSTP